MPGIFDSPAYRQREERRNTIAATLWAICILVFLLWSFLWYERRAKMITWIVPILITVAMLSISYFS